MNFKSFGTCCAWANERACYAWANQRTCYAWANQRTCYAWANERTCYAWANQRTCYAWANQRTCYAWANQRTCYAWANERTCYAWAFEKHVMLGQIKEHVMLGQIKEHVMLGQMKEHVMLGQMKEHVMLGQMKNMLCLGKSKEHVMLGQIKEHVMLGQIKEHVMLGQIKEHVMLGQIKEHVMLGQIKEHVMLGQMKEQVTIGQRKEHVTPGQRKEHVTLSAFLIEITRNAEETILTVDSDIQKRLTAGPDYQFGNATTNSAVFIGGLPAWYGSKLSLLALPSAFFEPRFQGAVKDVVFTSDDGIQKAQELQESQGIRTATFHPQYGEEVADDHCEKDNPCLNGGACISTDGGPICDCRTTDYEGDLCEQSESFSFGVLFFECDLSFGENKPSLALIAVGKKVGQDLFSDRSVYFKGFQQLF
ncbi:neurexin-3 [Caerostris darwini]|uniref:Neurexin-3 n=1 Tax=Caerostris darwini TaxID=1538125 RepID=A0AAV4TDB5_9ARAC|nr:neurexin-3 [Caerostris darwini]